MAQMKAYVMRKLGMKNSLEFTEIHGKDCTHAEKFCKSQCVAGLKSKKFSPRALKEAVIHLKKCIDQFVVREPFFLK